jgi:DNA-binding beta-propeller fold protein YncE
VADTFNNRIQKFDSKGNFLKKWGSSGTEAGQFDSPCNIAIDELSNVYVVDENNKTVQKFDSEGRFMKTWAMGTDFAYLSFRQLCGIALDRDGYIYITDYKKCFVQKFNQDLED